MRVASIHVATLSQIYGSPSETRGFTENYLAVEVQAGKELMAGSSLEDFLGRRWPKPASEPQPRSPCSNPHQKSAYKTRRFLMSSRFVASAAVFAALVMCAGCQGQQTSQQNQPLQVAGTHD